MDKLMYSNGISYSVHLNDLIRANHINGIIDCINNNNLLSYLISRRYGNDYDNCIISDICRYGKYDMVKKVFETFNFPKFVLNFGYHSNLIIDIIEGKNEDSYRIIKFLIEKYNLSKNEILDGGHYRETTLYFFRFYENIDTIKLIIEKASLTYEDIDKAHGEYGDKLIDDLYEYSLLSKIFYEYGILRPMTSDILKGVLCNDVKYIIKLIDSNNKNYYDYSKYNEGEYEKCNFIKYHFVIEYICQYGKLYMLKKIMNKYNLGKEILNSFYYNNLLITACLNKNSYEIIKYLINKLNLTRKQIFHNREILEYASKCTNLNTLRLIIERGNINKNDTQYLYRKFDLMSQDALNIFNEYNLIN